MIVDYSCVIVLNFIN